MTTYITDFGTERFRRAFATCTDPYGCGDATRTEWPNNVLSIHTFVYDSGVIARPSDSVVHRVDPVELARCERLATALGNIMDGQPVGMKSEGDDPFYPYFQVVSVDVAGTMPGPPKTVDAALIRSLFAGTIAPFDHVFVEPLREGGFFWREVTSDLYDEDEAKEENPDFDAEVAQRLSRWRELMGFLHDSEELVQPSFVSIGFNDYEPPKGASVLGSNEPREFEMKGSCLPRMPFAFTRAGSLVGLFGAVVWT